MKAITIFTTEVLIGNLEEVCFPAGKYAVIADRAIAEKIGRRVAERLGGELFLFSGGEQAKTRETKAALEDALLAKGFGRDCTIVAIGGGVTTDLVGFVAATFCRGVPLITIPTTLLAMIDSAVGGKVGVNTPAGKNLIGLFYPARRTICDVHLLVGLPEREWLHGMSEIVKHSCIASRSLFEMLAKNSSRWKERDPEFLTELVEMNITIKKQFVEADFRDESGVRAALNFGHTVAHALEAATGYTLPHGEAVAFGVQVEGWLSARLGFLQWEEFEKLLELMELYDFPTAPSNRFESSLVQQKMALDKKNRGGVPHLVLLEALGKVARLERVEANVMEEGLEWMLKRFT